MDILAVALTHENIQDDPQLWEKVDRGDFRVVYASPEILLNQKSHFYSHTMKAKSTFRDNLTLIALDEAHTIWSYRNFRKEFSHIKDLRIAFPSTPWAVLSATFPPHIVSYVQQTLNLKLPSDIITTKGRRTNIDILLAELPGRTKYSPLLDLIPSGKFRFKEEIPKTLVSVDSVKTARHIAIALRRKLRKKSTNYNPSTVIRCYYLCIDAPTKEETHRLIECGDARIVICTDAMSLGVDFPDIEKVIQWGVDDKLDLDTLVQRIGRVERNQDLQGVALIFAPSNLLDPITRAAASVAEQSISLPQPSQPAWVGNELGSLDYEDEPVAGVIPSYQNRDLSKFSLPVTRVTLSEVTNLTNKMYKEAENADKIIDEARAELMAPKKSVPGQPQERKQPIDKIEPALLWFLNTVGCRHRCILHYLRYPDVFEDNLQKSWCCDNCAISKRLSLKTTSTAGVYLRMSVRAPAPPPLAEKSISAAQSAKGPVIGRKILKELGVRLERYRKGLHQKLQQRRVIPAIFSERHVIPDGALQKLVSGVREAVAVQCVEKLFQSAGFSWTSSLLREKEMVEIFNLLNAMLEESVRTASGMDTTVNLIPCTNDSVESVQVTSEPLGTQQLVQRG